MAEASGGGYCRGESSRAAASLGSGKRLRALMRFAIKPMGLRTDDPTAGVKPPKIKTQRFYTRSEADIARFEAAHPIGIKPRLAIALRLSPRNGGAMGFVGAAAGQRRCAVRARQQKGDATLDIPDVPELQRALDGTGTEHLTFLTTRAGTPYTPNGFSYWFRHCCRGRGCPGMQRLTV
jgi:hypothetical protein